MPLLCECHGKGKWHEPDRLLFSYRFPSEPQIDDVITLADDETVKLPRDVQRHTRWRIVRREWHTGALRLIISPMEQPEGIVPA